MKYDYNDFVNKVFALPLLSTGHNSFGITKEDFIKSVYQEAFDLLVFCFTNRQSLTFNMVCIRLKEITHFEEVLKSDEQYAKVYNTLINTKADFESKIEKRRQENIDFNEYWRVYMLGEESRYKKHLQR